MQEKLYFIDFYKGIAMLMVIMIHASIPFTLIPPLRDIAGLGDSGCQIFFTISAFCLCLSFSHKQKDYKTFMAKRFKRIAPGYWLTIALTYIVAMTTILITGKNQIGSSTNIRDIIPNIFLLNGLTWYSAENQVVRGGGTSVRQ